MKKPAVPVPYTGYEVGYAKPPKGTQFKKGQSGNPDGRPKGSKNKPKPVTTKSFNKIILDEAYREIPVNDAAGSITMPILQAGLRSMTVKAARGDHRSLKLLTDLIEQAEAEETQRMQFELDRVTEYLIRADQEVQRREKNGQSVADIIPHPDDIFINYDTGTVTVIGPLTYTDKKRMMRLLEVREQVLELIEEHEEDLIHFKDPKSRAKTRKTQKKLQETVQKIDNHLQGWRPKD